MKAISCVCCILVLTCFTEVAHSETPQNKLKTDIHSEQQQRERTMLERNFQIQQELLDALTTDESLKVKRPFCNAFTGCGRKRSFHENSVESQDAVASGSIRLPLPVYKALLKAASQNIRGAIDRETNEYRLSGIPQVYLPRMSLHKRLDIPSTSLK